MKSLKKTVQMFVGKLGWLTCPHCKQVIFFTDKDATKALFKWRKQKP